MTPLIFDEARVPGVLQSDPAGPFLFTVNPGEPRIARAAFEGDLALQGNAYLVFSMHSPYSHCLRADIIAGDTGYPSIHLVNADGTVFRFSRGNLKDFFDISRPNEPQTIQLPLSSFIYDRDLKSNVPLKGDFFEPGIVKLYFDFLRHPDRPIDICLSGFACVQTTSDTALSLDIRDFVEFAAFGQSSILPCFSTTHPNLDLNVSLTRAALTLGHAGIRLRIALIAGEEEIQTRILTLHDETVHCPLHLPRIGSYWLHGELLQADDAVLARSHWPVVRVPGRVPRHRRPTILGISDSSSQERIAAAGGSWDRTVATLHNIIQARGSFRFKPGLDPLNFLPPGPGRKRILAVFHMPKWLSSRPDAPDFYRYAPRDWGLYRDMVGWLAQEAWASGVTHYEIWNEATALGHWNGSFDEMLQLHRETRDTIRAAVPEMVLLGGCTHSWTFDYLEKFLAAGGAETCDGLALHGYTYQPEDYLENFERLEEMLERHCPERPDFGVHISEIGFRTPAFSLDAQADWFTLFTLEAACRERVKAMLWFRYTNPRPEISSGYRQNSSTGYALVGHQDSYCRPAYGAYVFLHGLLQQADEITGEGAPDARLYTVFSDGAAIARINGGPEPAMRPTGWVELPIQRLDPGAPARVHVALDPEWAARLG